MKLSKKMPKAQTKFIVKIVLLIFTISTLLFPQYLSESQRNNLEAQLKRQAGKKTIVVEFYAPTEYSSYAYGEYLGAWSKRNGYELSYKTDGVGNYKVTLYKPSKEELEQRRIAAEKEAKEKAKKREQERLAKFDRNPEEGLKYGIQYNNFELFKKYYYPYKEELLKNGDTNAIGDREFEILYGERYSLIKNISRRCLATNVIKYLEFLDKEGEILWNKVKLIDFLGYRSSSQFDGRIKLAKNEGYVYPYYIKHNGIDNLCYVIKKSTSSKKLLKEDEEDEEVVKLSFMYLMLESYQNLLKDILKADYNKDYYNLIDTDISDIYKRVEVLYEFKDTDIYKKWDDIITFIDFDFENEEDALKLYDAFIYRYEKYSKWYDNNLPYYKELLKASFDIRKEWRENYKKRNDR